MRQRIAKAIDDNERYDDGFWRFDDSRERQWGSQDDNGDREDEYFDELVVTMVDDDEEGF